jgi:hypothetical protein
MEKLEPDEAVSNIREHKEVNYLKLVNFISETIKNSQA